MINDPAVKTTQYDHQKEVYFAHRNDECFGLFWEMGLGKTKVSLDVASHLFLAKRIQVLIVIAPNTVYKNWLGQEMPVHLAVPYAGMAYPKSGSERDKMRKLIFLDPDFKADALKVLCISYDSICTDHGMDFVQKVLMIYKCMVIADESTAIKTASTVRTKRAKEIGKAAEHRWIATGTPVAQSPFDIHSQIAFMNPSFWASHGLRSFSAFKNEFGEFTLRQLGNGRHFNELKSYKRLDVLQNIIKPITSRLLKEDSTINLPPKSYALRTFEMAPAQLRLYEQVQREFEAELGGGLRIDAPLAIVRLARLQQITSGFVTTEEYIDDDEDVNDFAQVCRDPERIIRIERKVVDVVPPDKNPKLKLLVELLDQCSHKVIVWSRFTRDIDNIMTTLGERGIRFDGSVASKNREIALERFRNPADSAQVLVVNIATISHGVTLTIAKTMIYYSNSFSLEKRLQSEDRNHRIGQDSPVLIIDLAAEETVDAKIIRGLREKFDIAAQVTGDRFREWISA